MDGNMGFSQQRQGGHALGLELVARDVEQGGHGRRSRVDHGFENELLVVEQMGRTTFEFKNAMHTDSVHSSTPRD
jgi:hypothetical protein